MTYEKREFKMLDKIEKAQITLSFFIIIDQRVLTYS